MRYDNKQLPRGGKPFIIYALVCPMTLEVKYVGQTTDLEERVRQHRPGCNKNPAYNEWLTSLRHLKPYRVILETGVNRLVKSPAKRRDWRSGNIVSNHHEVWLSSVAETKWLKRFRRTIVNANPVGIQAVYDALVNPKNEDAA